MKVLKHDNGADILKNFNQLLTSSSDLRGVAE